MNIKKKTVGFKKNIKKCGYTFHYNIREDPVLGVVYVAVRRIPCNFYACLSKLYSTWYRRQYQYNQDQCKGENQQCIQWPIIRLYNNQQIIHVICCKKQHETTNSDINVNIKQNAISNIALNIGRDIS